MARAHLKNSKREWRTPLASTGLFLATAAWGASFFMVKKATAQVGIWPFYFWRFAFTVLLMALLFPSKYANFRKRTCQHGAVLGFFLFTLLWTQTQGLQYTSAGKSGFLTSLYVPFVPLMGWLFFKFKVHYRHILVVAVAVLGLFILTDPGEGQALTLKEWWSQVNIGDIWTVGAAVLATFHILFTEKFTRVEEDSLALGMWQFLWCFIFVSMGTGFVYLDKGPFVPLQWDFRLWPGFSIGALIFEAAIATCFSFMMQIICQKTLGSLKSALIFALEAPFATGFAFIFIGEKLSSKELVGAAIVFLVSIIPESWLRREARGTL